MFEWDHKKATLNLQKHGISFEETSSVFFDPEALDGPDLKHSEEEPRFLRIGISVLGKVLVASYTIRRKYNEISQIRIISARKANKKEKQAYQRKG